jgi:hypothetical protein
MMATLDLRTAPRNDRGQLVAGQGVAYAPGRAYIGAVVPLALPSFVVDIKQEILRAVAVGELLTRADIARAVKRKKSTWLNEHIEALVSSGHLRRHIGAWRSNANVYFYEVAS